MNCYFLGAEQSPSRVSNKVSTDSRRHRFQEAMDTRHGFGTANTGIGEDRLVFPKGKAALATYEGV